MVVRRRACWRLIRSAREIVLIQVTSADHVADRLAKVMEVPELPGLAAAGA